MSCAPGTTPVAGETRTVAEIQLCPGDLSRPVEMTGSVARYFCGPGSARPDMFARLPSREGGWGKSAAVRCGARFAVRL